MIWHTVAMLAFLPISRQTTDTVRVCLAPARAQMVAGNTDGAIAAVRETFTAFLSGPSLAVAPLNARLVSQVREEAKLANCPYLLFTTLKLERKEGRGLLARVASGAVETGAWAVAGSSASIATRVAAGAAVSAAVAAREVASSVRTKDELTVGYRLENADGKVLVEKSEKRKASSDGEDLLTPLVERAAGSIAATMR